ncbi:MULTISPECIES: PhnD/SsuA/transferrin family substrate-binding protein [Halorussus]|uniref:PhnD/SsuA/transferrin family substrate-binding protein n=1 Tax=Halorussus TaxID=1070314 RepID=UPI000E21574D|nr:MULTISPECIES: PhnD/SsuA/transferrin family substrate-binding protein [Halorussus]NHN60373.1 PhnD/SsuA/transferrin family substrate-binding protein [Halorussus sp. JP-T4]
MANRRKFLKSTAAVGAVGLTGTAGCIGNLGGSGSGDETTVNFILSPAESDVDVQKQYEPLFSYLEDETGVTIESNVAKDYAAVLQALKSGQADIADAAPAVAIAGKKAESTDIMGIRVAYGAAKYFSLMTTKASYDGINELSDLEGKTIAFADPLSTSGSLFPLYMLSKAGLDVGGAPQGDPVDFKGQWSDHSTARETLVNRDPVKAAGTGAFSTIAHVPKDQLPKRVKDINPSIEDAGSADPQLDLLQASDPIPRAPILARRDWEADARDDVRKALLNAEESDLIDENADEELWFTGVTEGEISDYDPVEAVLNELGLELGDI